MSESRHRPCVGWFIAAVVTCPCHLPLLAALLSGTAAGALLHEHLDIAALLLAGLFVASLSGVLQRW